MKQTFKLNLAVLIFAVVSFLLSSHTAYAYDLSFITNAPLVKNVEDTVSTEPKNVEHRAEQATEAISNKASHAVDKVTDKPVEGTSRQNRFNATQTKKCEKKEAKISQKLDTISERGAKQLTVFHTIATRVEGFYVQKNYSVDGYSNLVAELDAQYDKSLVAVTTTQNASDSWGCSIQDPVASLNTFMTTKRAETATLKAYKDKVRELIILVKQAGGTN
jgi:Skp family chaperone for outer membrane proteins